MPLGGPPTPATTFVLPYVPGKTKAHLDPVYSEQRSQAESHGESQTKEKEGVTKGDDIQLKTKIMCGGLDCRPLQANSIWLYLDHVQGSPALQRHAMKVWFKGHVLATVRRHRGHYAAQTYRRTLYMEPLPGRVHNLAWRISISRHLADLLVMWGKRINSGCFKGARLSKQFPPDEPWGAFGDGAEQTTEL
ncbi:hypothetical protein SODALDRAFT_332658 [Sodiomyces alkalinus F11]|uniref:Uncharacterized protein n=1 Tax=Sodiomyces alkalinus (strain CBS 110278 / VKM F-3762 / F11) TaxID=1314773 RepID=A0A3N2PXI2_SODAK|nr:hypothetical protein SODALDRAFT_332658 [Sodiomyces alkalinus F11]ROT39221.1 hypothetical protein SODALDRAFT_332658 [Sodiomyces alkalinus F11]